MDDKPQILTNGTNFSKRRIKLKNVVFVVLIIIISITVVFFLSTNNIQNNVASANQISVGQTVSPELYHQISNVDYPTLSSIGSGTASHFNPISGDRIVTNGKPVVLYVGANYCPYCASERWALAVALSKFGTFNNLNYMLSSPTDVYPNTPTMSFHGATFTSKYIDFQSVEVQDRSGNILETLTPDQKNNFVMHGQNGEIPFVNIANQYVFTGSQFSPSTLAGLSWSDIGKEINDPNSEVAKGIDGAANIIINDICKSTNHNPSDVCSQSFANLES